MDFAEKIAALAVRIEKQKAAIETEEACKNAFVMPFLNALGYDVFNPEVVVPEFTADVGIKKKEKVDYAIKLDGKVSVLIECKACGSDLSEQHMSQLYRYFSVTEARFAILTNGIQYWFFSDLEQTNRMDQKPFFEFNMLDYRSNQVDELKKFSITSFDVGAILATASNLKYTSAIRREFLQELKAPSDDMVKLFASRIYEGRFTQSVREEFTELVEKAFKETIRELVNDRLSSALDAGGGAEPFEEPPVLEDAEGIITTQEEIEAYNIIRAIVREVVDVGRVAMRDAKSYCAILLDDNNRRPIARLHFNTANWYLGLFDADKNEEKMRINSLEDIFLHAAKLKAAAAQYGEVAAT